MDRILTSAVSHTEVAAEKVAALTKVASVKVKEAGDALAAAGDKVTTVAGDAVQEAQTALENVVKSDAPTTAELTAAQDKVATAEAAVAEAATTTADAGAKAELGRVESSLAAAKQIVSDAIAKAETVEEAA
jgi:hypothetical protein